MFMKKKILIQCFFFYIIISIDIDFVAKKE